MKALFGKVKAFFGPVQLVVGLLLLVAAVVSLRPWTWGRKKGFAEMEAGEMEE